MKKETRRNFIKGGITAGVATAAGIAAWLKNTDVQETGETVRLLSQDGEIIELDKAYLKLEAHVTSHQMAAKAAGREPIPGRKFVMVIDLGRCKNARKCITACQKMHYLPEYKEWLKVKLM